ncbi:phage tail terminator protein [Peribacillus frigoritolerans]|uniref:phage tail terminator protein n=1 Tax=Peribacillus frigoritolerans TaxID=450367 RepID=UPI003D072CD3
MIHRYLKNEAKIAIPELVWSVNFHNGKLNTGTVYSEGGGTPDTYDFEWRYPEYMIFIRSSDWDKAELFAEVVHNLFHKKLNFRVTEQGRTFYVQSLFALSEPIRLGVSEDNKMEYSINIRATLREEN